MAEGIEFSSVGRLAKAFGVIPAEMKAELRPRVRAAAQLIADQVKVNASWSGRIPAAVYVRTGLSSVAAATIGVSQAKAPEARVLELGNEGSRNASTFRHPVFGDMDNWVIEDTRPFFFKSLRQKGAAATEMVASAVRVVCARNGLT